MQPDAENRVSFRTSLANPCIFAVGIARKRTRNPTLNIDAAPQTVSPPTTPPPLLPPPTPTPCPPPSQFQSAPPFPPLKCTLFVTYPRSIAEADQASSFDLTVMVGMDLHTVTAVSVTYTCTCTYMHTSVQWSLSIVDTTGPRKCVLIREVSLFQRLIEYTIET